MAGIVRVLGPLRGIVLLLISAAAIVVLAGWPVAPADGATPTPTPAGAVAYGKVLVLSGDALPRNSGQEKQPPVWLTIDANGTTATVTIGNATKIPLDFTGTVVIDLGSGVQATTVLVSVGTAVIQGNQVIWNDFSLSSGQIVPALISLTVAAGGAQTASGLPSIRGVSIDAKDPQSGTAVVEQVQGGGPVFGALAPATSQHPSGATAAVATSAGRDTSSTLDSVAIGLLGGVLVVLLALVWLAVRLSRRLERNLARFVDRIEPAMRTLGAPMPREALLGASGDWGGAAAPGHRSVAVTRDAAMPHAATLEARTGPETGRVWTLDREEVNIGRQHNNTIPLADPRVSALHARILHQADGSYLLIDNRSTNGTTLNGHALTGSATLRDGDAVQIGGVTFIFHEALPVPRPS